jgi:CRP/FNR family transcriptional regulator
MGRGVDFDQDRYIRRSKIHSFANNSHRPHDERLHLLGRWTMSSARFGNASNCVTPQLPLCGLEQAHTDGGCVQCHIRHLTICGAFQPDELRHLEPLVGHRQLAPGQPLFDEEEESQFAYNLTEGTIRLYKLLPDGRRQIIGFAIPGDFLGLSSGGHYVYSAEAVSGAALCRFKRADLQRLFAQFPAMERRVLSMASDELAAAQDQMLLLGRKTPMEKVASFLLTLTKRLERVGRRSDELALAMTRADIADFLGLTVETVSRTFSKLRAGKTIALPSSGQIQLLDKGRLEAIAAGHEN